MISPSDVKDERTAVHGIVRRWNSTVGAELAAFIQPVMWEEDVHPQYGAEPQAIVNPQIVDNADFGIAIFWTRLGTPTSNHESGSVEEIMRLNERGVPVLVYHSQAAIPSDHDRKELGRLDKFRETVLNKHSCYVAYKSLTDFEMRLGDDLTRVVRTLKEPPTVAAALGLTELEEALALEVLESDDGSMCKLFHPRAFADTRGLDYDELSDLVDVLESRCLVTACRTSGPWGVNLRGTARLLALAPEDERRRIEEDANRIADVLATSQRMAYGQVLELLDGNQRRAGYAILTLDYESLADLHRDVTSPIAVGSITSTVKLRRQRRVGGE